MKGIKSAASGLRLEERGGMDSCVALAPTSAECVSFAEDVESTFAECEGLEEDIEDEDTESEDIDEYTGGDTAAGREEGNEVTLLERE